MPHRTLPAASRLAMAPVVAVILYAQPGSAQGAVTPAEARSIAREAYIYGFPVVDNYRILHAYFVDSGGPQYRSRWNTLTGSAHVFTPADTLVQTPNSDTPYMNFGFDLRAEPMVIGVPEIPKQRYYSVQLIDAYTHNFAYIGSRTTGNSAGHFLLAGPGWSGPTPPGVRQVIRSETPLGFAIIRTQLFDAADVPNVAAIQKQYSVQPLSQFLGRPAPRPAPALQWVTPLTPEQERSSLAFFRVLDFVLRLNPVHSSERALRARLAQLGIGDGPTFDVTALAPAVRQALAGGMADAWKEYEAFQTSQLDTRKVTSADMFGTRAHLRNRYINRMAGAVRGIYGNSEAEAMYPSYYLDSNGQQLDGGSSRYTLRFAPGRLPPVNAFWSITMYRQPASLLVENPLQRYLINSPMLPKLRRDADGGVTLLIQHESPGPEHEANWLPAPAGPFSLVMRLYWPKPEALHGDWQPPPLRRVTTPAVRPTSSTAPLFERLEVW